LKEKAMKKETLIYNQHEENKSWFSTLNFIKEDIHFLEEKLGEISLKYTDKEILSDIEHYQNQFIIQKNNIDEIEHLITLDEDKLVSEIKKNPVAVEHRSTNDHNKERELITVFETNFKELRNDFIRFLAKWM
jgi:hypothetical protein